MSADGLDLRNDSKLNVPRLFVDISKFAAQVIQQSRSSQIPLTDDCIYIHHLCEKIEYLLLFGLKPKPRKLFSAKKIDPEYYSFLRAVCRGSKSLIDGLRYINVQHDLKTDMGRGRGLLRYFLAQNCLGDVLQTATSDLKTLKDYYTDGALIKHSGMHHVIESLYALYNIQFCINPVAQNMNDLDMNWPNTSSRIMHIPSAFPNAPLSHTTPSVPYHNENIQKWLSSGIGSTSEKPPSLTDNRSVQSSLAKEKEAEMEEKQEILARVITDLEIKNAQLESQLNITESELKIKNEKPSQERFLPVTPRLCELNDSIINQSRNLRKQMRSTSTPYSLAVPLSPHTKTQRLLRSAVGLDFETMSNVSEGSEKRTSLSSEKFENSGFEPISSGSKIQSEAYDSDMFPKSLLDGYHRQMEQYDERLIALEADIRIMREEKRRVEEECQKLREENDNLSGRLDEVSNTQSPTTGDVLIKEIEILAKRVETLSSELSLERSRNTDLEKSLSVLESNKTETSCQTYQKGIHFDLLESDNQTLSRKNDELSERISQIDQEYNKKIRDLTQERDTKVSSLESEIRDLEEKSMCLDSDLQLKTRQCREIQIDLERLREQVAQSDRPALTPLDIENFYIDFANFRAAQGFEQEE